MHMQFLKRMRLEPLETGFASDLSQIQKNGHYAAMFHLSSVKGQRNQPFTSIKI